ncbi:hypothetical protein LTR97_004647 [Elasticomyces elasticus]|uniref:Uncharacterized protein n=1 Tax=Elasticomyces elasticus TaxID=574655 RepID=A0AAN7WDC9_9PEZI|nr:hypothetical protein LTR97_004647 [Elasticomyces elasticus]
MPIIASLLTEPGAFDAELEIYRCTTVQQNVEGAKRPFEILSPASTNYPKANVYHAFTYTPKGYVSIKLKIHLIFLLVTKKCSLELWIGHFLHYSPGQPQLSD